MRERGHFLTQQGELVAPAIATKAPAYTVGKPKQLLCVMCADIPAGVGHHSDAGVHHVYVGHIWGHLQEGHGA
jgi:hypothetical protein